MKVSLNWLKTLVDTHLLADDIAHKLTMAGLEVEEMTPVAAAFTHIVVAEIKSVAPHPNADKLRVTGKKMTEKIYVSHSGYPGGQKRKSMREVMEKSSTRVIEHAVRGMLPHNRLGREQFRSLFVYEGAEHPHQAQQPAAVDMKNL